MPTCYFPCSLSALYCSLNVSVRFPPQGLCPAVPLAGMLFQTAAAFPSLLPSVFAQCLFSKVFLDYLKQHSSPNPSTPYIPFLQNTCYHLTSGMSLCQYCFPAESPVSRRMPGKYGTPAIPVCGMHG